MRFLIFNFVVINPGKIRPHRMEPNSKQSQTLELWLEDVQSYIYKVTAGPAHETCAFPIQLLTVHLFQKNKKGFEELSINLLKKFQDNYRKGFQLEIWHPQIRQIKESFMHEILNREPNLCSIILATKDFPSPEPDRQSVKDFPVRDYRDLFMVGDSLVQTLQYELVPLCDRLSSIEHMDSFFEAKPEWSLNTRSGGNICTDLIVAGLNRRRDLHIRYEQLMQGIQQRIDNQQIHPDSKQLLILCYDAIRK
jgi:hypothetical protein